MWRGAASAGKGVATVFLRHFSRTRAPNLRKINPKVPPQEAATIAESLYHVIQQHGPLTLPNTWNLAKVTVFDPTLILPAYLYLIIWVFIPWKTLDTGKYNKRQCTNKY